MKLKKKVGIASAMIVGTLSVFAGQVTTTGYGSIPGAAPNAYSGSGIDQSLSVYSVTTGIGGGLGGDFAVPSDTLTLAEEATGHGALNPAPGQNGAGTYTVSTGFGDPNTRSPWNFDFYADSSQGRLAGYIFSLTEKNLGNGKSYTFDPSLIPDNVGGPNAFGNSESLDFAFAGVPISYDASLNDTYTFTLNAESANGQLIASDMITVVAGTGAAPAPDGGSTVALMGLGVGALAFLRRRYVGC